MTKDDDSHCPRCGQGFHCGAHDATPCACATVKLDAALLASLRAGYRGCLCVACLVELQARAQGPSALAAPAP